MFNSIKTTLKLSAILVVGLSLLSCRGSLQEGPDPSTLNLSCVVGENSVFSAEHSQTVEVGRSATAAVPFSFTTSVQAIPAKLDVVFLMDSSNSMVEEIADVANNFSDIMNEISNSANVREPAFAVASFKDFPDFGGRSSDRPFTLDQAMSLDEATVQAALDALVGDVGGGGDSPESASAAIYQVATGFGYDYGNNGIYLNGNDIAPYDTGLSSVGTLGGVGFRAEATKVVILSTDAWFKGPTTATNSPNPPSDNAPAGSASKSEAIAALNDLSILFVGLGSKQNFEFFWPFDDLSEAATATSAFKKDGTPMVYEVDADGHDVADNIIASLKEIADQIRVKVEISGLPEGISATVDPADRYLTSGQEAIFNIIISNDNRLAKCYKQYFDLEIKLHQIDAAGNIIGEAAPAQTLGVIVSAGEIN